MYLDPSNLKGGLLGHRQDPRNIPEEPVGLNNSLSRYSSSMYIPEKRVAGDSQVFSCSKDEVAIILLGSENTDNNLNYKNICLAYPLGAPNWNMIEHIEKGIKPSRVDADWFEALILGLDVLREQTITRSTYLPSSKAFVKLVNAMKQYYAPRKSIIAERVSLGKRFQREGESIAKYARAIKQIGASCNYGAFLGEV
uniref:Ku70/Ku80 N-terminal alpha/beta domain-containing protein n=1 Tax=Timema poppense TaxID=170557 RepID=A0A7R9D2T8_TIMPO|nr:unnamed protein product [Timema poppensis]